MTLDALLEGLRDGSMSVSAATKAVERDDALLRAWWSRYGLGMVQTIAGRMSGKAPRKASTPVMRSNGGAPRPGWRDQLRKSPELALDIEVPVSGVSKAIRDLTSRDIETIEDGYRGIAHVATARAERWSRVRKKMWSDDTVGSAIDAGRLKLNDLLVTSPGEPLEVTG